MLRVGFGKRVLNLETVAVVDTNVLVAVMFEDDRNHKGAIKAWEAVQKALVPTIVLFELAFFLTKYKVGVELLAKVVTDPKVEVVANDLDDILYLSRHSKEIKHCDDVGDFLLLSVAERLGVDLKTFDNELQELYEDIQK
jgi:predicted nucleic acid-binding protein